MTEIIERLKGAVPFDYFARVKVGIVLLALVCLLSSRRLVRDAGKLDLKFVGMDELSLYDKRFDGVKSILPAHGVVGYIGDKQREAGGIRDYYLTQYALSPLIVDNSIHHHFVIVNFPDANSAIPVNYDLVLVRDFGNGVILFESSIQ